MNQSVVAHNITRCQGCRCNLISGDWCPNCAPKPDLAAPGLFTVGAAAAAMNVPKDRIQKFLRDGGPCLRVGRSVRVRLEELRPWLEHQDECRRNFDWFMENCPD